MAQSHAMRDNAFECRLPSDRDRHRGRPDELDLQCALTVYQRNVDPGYRLLVRPDRVDRKNRAVDGIFVCANHEPIAIEITELLTFKRQSETRVLFAKHLREIEATLARRLPSGIWCELPADPFVPGHDWSCWGEALAAYIQEAAGSLLPGGRYHRIAGLPFDILLCVEPSWPMPFRFVRSNPPDDQISADLLSNMVKALHHKRDKLLELRARGYRTALMITSADANFYRMTWDRAYRFFLEAEKQIGSHHVTDVLFAFTADLTITRCMAFKGEPAFRDVLNARGMKFGPEYAHLWALATSA